MILKKNIIHELLTEYSKSHKNKINILIHEISVPLILHATIALVCFIPFPNTSMSPSPLFNWGLVFVAFMAIIYLQFNNLKLYLGLISQVIFMFLISIFLMKKYGLYYLVANILLYIFSWVAQLLGHKIEGKKPSFTNDMNFLLVGPLWVVANIYKLLGIKY